MKRVLLLANHPAFNKSIIRWAYVAGSRASWDPVVLSISGSLGPAMATMNLTRDLDVLYPPPGLGWPTASAAPSRVDQIKASTRTALKALLPRPLTAVARFALLVRKTMSNVRTWRRQERFVRNLILKEEIAAVLLNESSPAYGATVFIRAARASGIPVITAPIDHYGQADHAELYLTDEPLSADRGLNRWAADRFPTWAVTHKNKRMIRVYLDQLLAYEWLGWRSPAPWRMVGGWEDVVAVTGEAMRDFYLGEGLRPESLHLVGSPELDLMSEVIATPSAPAELRGALGLDPHKPIILTALVANHYLAGRPDAEYETYEELIEAWVRPLGAIDGYSVVVNLHPSQRVEDYRYIEQWGVRICQRDITALIPLSDIFVACSSTSRLAIACGKPLVYYDVYRYSTAMPTLTFPNAGGTSTVLNHADLLGVLRELTGNTTSYREAFGRQQANAAYWGPLDAKSVDRFGALVDALNSRRAKAPASRSPDEGNA